MLLASYSVVAQEQADVVETQLAQPVEQPLPEAEPVNVGPKEVSSVPQLDIAPATTAIAPDVIQPASQTIAEPVDMVQQPSEGVTETEPVEPPLAAEAEPPLQTEPSEVSAPPEELPIGGFGDFRMMFGTPSEIEVPSWEDNEFDPRPAPKEEKEEEITLPLPCGGAMVFRRVRVGGDPGLLGEQAVELGSPSVNDAPFDYRRSLHVAGGFGDEEGRYFYLGKYEVTALQYQSVMEDCPETRTGRRPAVGVSWHDAVEFSRRYTEWLFEKAPERLPQEDGVRGYLRLPTEVEWEYAARGGNKVDEEAFGHSLFPTGDKTIDEYAWFRESASSSFEPRPVGSLKPNPLGLYDILGNVAELVQDLFRLNVAGRDHGQAGGFLVKGGHFRSWRKSLRSSWRQEHPHFNPQTGKSNRLDTVGFRMAITVPVITSERRMKTVRDSWEMMPEEPLEAGTQEGCRDLMAEVQTTMSGMQTSLNQCLMASGQMPLPVFPEDPSLKKAPRRLPAWEQLRNQLEEMDSLEIRHYGQWFLAAKEVDNALLLFKQAARQRDGWSALAIGAMYDPRLFDAAGFEASQTPFKKPRPDLAMCWYQVAEGLGEPTARLWLRALSEGSDQEMQEGRCESIFRQHGVR